MPGAIPSLVYTPSWRGAQLKKHRDNFTVTLGAGDFSLRHRVQTGYGAHSASYPLTGVLSFGVKRPGREADHSPPSMSLFFTECC
jgi:hypothetical protein